MIKRITWIKILVFLASLYPVYVLTYGIIKQDLTADPIEYILEFTGLWGLRFLMITLAMTPLKSLTGWSTFIRLRRMFGLFTFFYVTLHLATYLVLDLRFDFSHLIEDIIVRPFITVGFAAWLIMLPMAITSTNKMVRRLGKKWKSLHKGIYLVTVLACLHFIWLVKSDLTEPLIYAGIGLLLLLFRFVKYLNVRSRHQTKTSQHPAANQ